MREALADAQELFAKGLGLKPKKLELERQVAASEGDIAANEGRILALMQQISEKVQIKGVRYCRAAVRRTDGSWERFGCESCGRRFVIDNRLLYTDLPQTVPLDANR